MSIINNGVKLDLRNKIQESNSNCSVYETDTKNIQIINISNKKKKRNMLKFTNNNNEVNRIIKNNEVIRISNEERNRILNEKKNNMLKRISNEETNNMMILKTCINTSNEKKNNSNEESNNMMILKTCLNTSNEESNNMMILKTCLNTSNEETNNIMKSKCLSKSNEERNNIEIYFSNRKDNKEVAEKMRDISSSVFKIQQNLKNIKIKIPNIKGIVKQKTFDKALEIYENNQVYYEENGKNSAELSRLEEWFMKIIEPKQKDDIKGWINREKSKIINGYSGYCDPSLYDYIKKPSKQTLENIIEMHKKIKELK